MSINILVFGLDSLDFSRSARRRIYIPCFRAVPCNSVVCPYPLALAVLLRAAGSPMSLVGEWGALQVLLIYVVIVVVNNNPFVV